MDAVTLLAINLSSERIVKKNSFLFASPLWLGPMFWGVLQSSWAQASSVTSDQLIRQQQRQQQLRQQQEGLPSVRLAVPPAATDQLPASETPCFVIKTIELVGPSSDAFQWALAAANPAADRAIGRCLGSQGINLVMKRLQNALIAGGYTTSRVIATTQNLQNGILQLTLVPGHIAAIRLQGAQPSAINLAASLPLAPGDLLNLRAIEQGLENLKRVPTVEADIQIAPAQHAHAQPGDSDLLLNWRQHKPWRLSFGVDDSGSRQTGKLMASATLSLDNLLRLSDLLYFSHSQDLGGGISGIRGTYSKTAHYSFPIQNWLWSLTTTQSHYYQQVVGINQSYIYSGDSQNHEIKWTRLLVRTGRSKTQAWTSAWLNSSRNFIEDTEILIQNRRSAGWAAGVSRVDYLGSASLSTNLAYRRGTGAFDAQPAPEEFSGMGTARLGVVSAAAQLSLPFAALSQSLRYDLAWRAQWNRTALTPIDRFSIGGRYTVRGFDGQNTLSAERGWLLRNDFSWSLPPLMGELYLGLDYGEVGGPSSVYLLGTRLAGAVLGWRGRIRQLSFDLFAGQPISRPSGFDTARNVAGFSLNASF
jgi:hemolysin activation/secretion protein